MKLFNQKSKKQKTSDSLLSFDLHCLDTNHDELKNCTVLKKYNVGSVSITVAKTTDGKGLYLINEPSMSNAEVELYSRIMKQLYLSAQPIPELSAQKIRTHIGELVHTIAESYGISKTTNEIFDKLMYYIIRDVKNYGIIGALMGDPDIEDILCENYSHPVGIIHRKFPEYGVIDTNIKFKEFKSMNSFVQKLVQKSHKSITAAVPITDAITDEGHRVSATYGKEISLPGPNFAIRKFSSEPFTIVNLINFNTLSSLMAAYIWLLLDVKALLLLVGPTSAGKTTTMGSVLSMTDPRFKITTIEDTPELKLPHIHWQRLITRKSHNITESKYDIDMGSLVSLALRSRPDYIVVGEVRGSEAAYLIQAAGTGHGGLTSFHATDAESALVRLESHPLNIKLAGQMLIWGIIRQNKVTHNHKIVRRITDITEVVPKSNSVELKKIFEWDPETDCFYPDSTDEVIQKSHRLKEVMRLKGFSEKTLNEDLKKRCQFLDTLALQKTEEFHKVSSEFSSFNMKNYL